MIARVVSLLSLTFILVAGTMIAAERVSIAQAPSPPADAPPTAASTEASAAPAASATQQPSPVVTAPATPAAAPDVTPSITAPPEPPSTPAVALPKPAPTPTPSPARVVSAPPLPPEKPAFEGAKAVAKYLFAAKELPSLGKAMAIGYYPRGCLSGGVELPVNGPNWQVMRVSRNRNWGHPSLVRFLERFAPAAAKATGWKGILVGDMAQPRGGPLPYGHTSHQIGLDVDIWFMPMPDHTLSPEERENTSAINLVSDDWKSVNPKTWTPQQIDFIRTAAEQPEVERVLVNAAIKKEICRVNGKNGGTWLRKIRPWYGHHDHIHVRLECPADSPNCRSQPAVGEDDGCGKGALDYWFSDKVLHPVKKPGGKPPKSITMAELPPACQTVLNAPAREPKKTQTGQSPNPSP